MRISRFLWLAVAAAGMAHAQAPYKITNTYTLGGDGGWDYIIPDAAHHRLFIARESRVLVIDENSGKQIGELAEIHGAHGVALDPSSGHGFATESEDKAVVMFDATTLKKLKTIPAADDADAIVFDAKSGRVFSLNGDANSATVIDAKTGNLITNLPLGGKPEYGASAGNGKLYVNIADKSEIVEIDTASLKITKRWATEGCKQPVALAIDTAHQRLFSGCRSGVMAISDYQNGKVVATAPIGKGVDGAAFDPASGNAFAANGEGTLTVIHQESPDQYRVVQTLPTQLGSRNVGLDPVSHKLFVVAAKFGPAPQGARRGPVLPASFSLMVISK
ncbi:YncE family protein [Granulicella cerasi]|uniref:YncE family protein n=1 Tax=Granulicella cerasi TaxID=741063 RepID=A0ABW1Z705_9BACT|nr:YncE family protein [Granulicella cerasi]